MNPFSIFKRQFKWLPFVLLAIASCSPEASTPPFQLPPNPTSLLSSAEGKEWKLARRFNNSTRMNMGDCFLSYRVTYFSDHRMNDNNGEHKGCGPTLEADWRFIKDQKSRYYIELKGGQLKELMNLEEDQKLFRIAYLDSEELILQYTHKQFSNKTTTITDIYVPSHVSVKDRTFHW